MITRADSRVDEYLELKIGDDARRFELDALQARRRRALERFETAGFPAARDEEWRQTNLSPVLRARPVRASRPSLRGVDISALTYSGCDRIVFVNGRHAPEASALPEGTAVRSLAGRGSSSCGAVADRLGAVVDGSFPDSRGVHPFAALNTALFEDAAVLVVPPGKVLERPIQVLWLTVPAADAAVDADAGDAGPAVEVSFPRLLVVAGEGSEASIIETFAGTGEGPVRYLVCPAAEFVCERGSVLHHTRLQVDSPGAFHLGYQHSRVDRSAAFHSCSLAFGGAVVRNDCLASLDGEGADCTLDGLYVVSGSQFVDNHMRVEHCRPHTTSHQLYKGVLDERARSVFNGRIFVHREAQKTDAKQTNRNLLLSDSALAGSNPQLEIFADDVRCTHGSTIGRLDEDSLFYLRARGIEREEAWAMLVYAFAREVTDRARFEPLRQDLEARLLGSLNGARSDGQGG